MKLKIFLIEDDLDDIELLEGALNQFPVAFELHSANDGSAAIEYIRSVNVAPDIIILDMNLPKVHGREVITAIKRSDMLKETPLLILTTSSAKEDTEYAYANGADKYLIKPSSVEEIEATVKAIIVLATGRTNAANS